MFPAAFHHQEKVVYVCPWTSKVSDIYSIFCCFFLSPYLGLHVEFSMIIHWREKKKIPSWLTYIQVLQPEGLQFYSARRTDQRLNFEQIEFETCIIHPSGDVFSWIHDWILGSKIRLHLHLEVVLKGSGRENPSYPHQLNFKQVIALFTSLRKRGDKVNMYTDSWTITNSCDEQSETWK